MPLSEQEQKMLDEMERQLFADDPRLARAFRHESSDRGRRDRRRIAVGLGGVVAGLLVLVFAVSIPAVWLGVLAFVGMLAGAIYAVTAPVTGKDASSDGASGSAQRAPKTSAGGRFMQQMEERWDKRSGDDSRF